MQKNAQAATEFIILVAAVLLIFIPLIYLFADYGAKASIEAGGLQVVEIANNMVYEAREVYFLGRFSREIITYNFPERITSMQTLYILSDSGDEEYYLYIRYDLEGKSVDLLTASEVPLYSSDPSSTCNSDCPAGVDGSTHSCYTCNFGYRSFSAGIRNFQLQTVQFGALGDILAVDVKVVEI